MDPKIVASNFGIRLEPERRRSNGSNLCTKWAGILIGYISILFSPTTRRHLMLYVGDTFIGTAKICHLNDFIESLLFLVTDFTLLSISITIELVNQYQSLSKLLFTFV